MTINLEDDVVPKVALLAEDVALHVLLPQLQVDERVHRVVLHPPDLGRLQKDFFRWSLLNTNKHTYVVFL